MSREERELRETGPVIIPVGLKPNKNRYFVCGVGSHCSQGNQKLKVVMKDDCFNYRAERIVGGELTRPSTRQPWTVSLLLDESRVYRHYREEFDKYTDGMTYYNRKNDKKERVCGGTIISRTHILTAAWCCTTDDELEYTIEFGTDAGGNIAKKHLQDPEYAERAGIIIAGTELVDEEDGRIDNRGQEFTIKNIKLHENYGNSQTYVIDYDIAIITLNSRLPFSQRNDNTGIAPLCLPATTNIMFTGATATASGWGAIERDGREKADRMRILNMRVLSEDDCPFVSSLTYLCAANNDGSLCSFDIGGPLVATENGRSVLSIIFIIFVLYLYTFFVQEYSYWHHK